MIKLFIATDKNGTPHYACQRKDDLFLYRNRRWHSTMGNDLNQVAAFLGLSKFKPMSEREVPMFTLIGSHEIIEET